MTPPLPTILCDARNTRERGRAGHPNLLTDASVMIRLVPLFDNVVVTSGSFYESGSTDVKRAEIRVHKTWRNCINTHAPMEHHGPIFYSHKSKNLAPSL